MRWNSSGSNIKTALNNLSLFLCRTRALLPGCDFCSSLFFFFPARNRSFIHWFSLEGRSLIVRDKLKPQQDRDAVTKTRRALSVNRKKENKRKKEKKKLTIKEICLFGPCQRDPVTNLVVFISRRAEQVQ